MSEIFNFEGWEWYHWLTLGGGAVVVVAMIIYAVAPRVRVPAGIASTLAAFCLGTGAGAVGLTLLGYQMPDPRTRDSKGGDGSPKGGLGGMGGMKGKGKKGPSPKAQLATLVAKLEQLTNKNLTIKFSDEQRQMLLKNLADLPKLEELEDNVAEERLKAMLTVVATQRDTLEAAGYRWPEPGGGFQMPPPPAPNPFAGGDDHKRLLALQAALSGKKP